MSSLLFAAIRLESVVAGFFVFSHKQIMGYFKINQGYSRVKECPAGLDTAVTLILNTGNLFSFC